MQQVPPPAEVGDWEEVLTPSSSSNSTTPSSPFVVVRRRVSEAHTASPDEDPAARAAQHAAQQEEALRQQGLPEEATAILAAAAAAAREEEPAATSSRASPDTSLQEEEGGVKDAATVAEAVEGGKDVKASTNGDQNSATGQASMDTTLSDKDRAKLDPRGAPQPVGTPDIDIKAKAAETKDIIVQPTATTTARDKPAKHHLGLSWRLVFSWPVMLPAIVVTIAVAVALTIRRPQEAHTRTAGQPNVMAVTVR